VCCRTSAHCRYCALCSPLVSTKWPSSSAPVRRNLSITSPGCIPKPSLSGGAPLQCAPMQTFRNLVPDSALVEETIQMLRSHGGRATASEVAAAVLELPGLDSALAASSVSEPLRAH